MKLKEIAAVSGKPGLFKVVKPSRTGLVLESLDEKKSRLATGPHHRVSLLHEISIYTVDYDKTIPLQEMFSKILKEFGDDIGVDGKSDPEELKAFIEHIAPDYDKDRVYVSDIKKLVVWYNILFNVAPETLEEKENEESKDTIKDENNSSEKSDKKESK